MAYDGTGGYTPPTPEFPAISGEYILASDYNAIINDIAAALSLVLVRDGQAAMLANLSMGGFKIASMANGVNPQDATTVLQVFTSPTFTDLTTSGTTTIDGGVTITGGNVAVTGTFTAPTATAGDSSTLVATTAFVAAAAFNAALPDQTGNAGKFVTTDGSTASWELPIPDQTGHAGEYLSTNGTAASWGSIAVPVGNIIYLNQLYGAF